MFLHLGRGVSVRLAEIVYIQDFAQTDASEENRRFWARLRRETPVRDLSAGRPRSFILTDHGVYLSAISSATLKKRSDISFAALAVSSI